MRAQCCKAAQLPCWRTKNSIPFIIPVSYTPSRAHTKLKYHASSRMRLTLRRQRLAQLLVLRCMSARGVHRRQRASCRVLHCSHHHCRFVWRVLACALTSTSFLGFMCPPAHQRPPFTHVWRSYRTDCLSCFALGQHWPAHHTATVAGAAAVAVWRG